jgi:hypothetical protein
VIANLLEKYRKAGGQIIHVLHQTPEGAPVFTPGTDLAKEFKEVKAQVRALRKVRTGCVSRIVWSG